MANRTTGRIPGQGMLWRCLKKPLVAALAGGVLAVFLTGFTILNQAHAQVANGVYQGSILDEDDNAVGAIKVTVSENARAVTSIEFVDFASDCILEANNNEPVSREMDVLAPPVLFEGVGFFAEELPGFFGFEAEEEGPFLNIILQATFVSDEELRGGMEVFGESFFFEEEPPVFEETPELITPSGLETPEPTFEPFPTEGPCDFFFEEFSFVASLVSAPPTSPPAPSAQPTATIVPIALPEAGIGASSGGGQFWTVLAAIGGASALATAGLAALRRRSV